MYSGFYTFGHDGYLDIAMTGNRSNMHIVSVFCMK